MIGFVLRLFKFSFFALVVLVAANTIRIRGKTVSDQVRLGMAHAERSPELKSARDWAREVAPQTLQIARDKREIPASERQKLKELLKELNY